MTDDAATPVAAEAAEPASIGWRAISVLAAAVLAALALYGAGVLLPYFVNGLHRLPLAEVASGAHDPKELWPQNAWQGPLQLAGFFGLALLPIVALAAVVGGVWLTSLGRRPEPGTVPKSLALLVIVAGSVAAVLFVFSSTGAALAAWRLD